MADRKTLKGERFEVHCGGDGYPPLLAACPNPPSSLYGIGNPAALVPGLAVIGARKATPYGHGCARRFARLAAEKGVCIISGGALGCDSEAHRAALDAKGKTVVVLGGGCDEVYPAQNRALFQNVIDSGGAVVSEQAWATPPLPFMFRARNRIIAGLAQAVLIVEAGLPSGTFSTADEALDAGREVLVVPGSIASPTSRGSNRLLLQGAHPVVDDESFEDALFRVCGMLKRPGAAEDEDPFEDNPFIQAVRAQPMTLEALFDLAETLPVNDPHSALMESLVEAEAAGAIAHHPDGRWGPVVHP